MSMNVSNLTQDRPAKTDAWLYLDEITHRALNDYTATISMLRLASMSMKDAVGQTALAAATSRLESAARTYQALRPSRGGAVRNLEDELERLCSSLASSILADRFIKLTLASEPVMLTARRSWQVSLIISELVTNAAKHAFGATRGGNISVSVRAVGRTLQCAVSDDGSASPDFAPGRGAGIVDSLAADLGGSISWALSSKGSTVLLCVPLSQG